MQIPGRVSFQFGSVQPGCNQNCVSLDCNEVKRLEVLLVVYSRAFGNLKLDFNEKSNSGCKNGELCVLHWKVCKFQLQLKLQTSASQILSVQTGQPTV